MKFGLDGMKFGLISGTSINRSRVFDDWEVREVDTDFGAVEVKTRGELVALNRHGFRKALPPHAINYRANVAALTRLGVESVVTLSSVGSLDPELAPGTLVSCTDYMSFAPKTFIDDRMSVFAPLIGNPLLRAISERSAQPIVADKIYAQTPGPRFETRAEVRALRALGADVVGMTFANEADLLLEEGVELTSFCMVDNYAHGVSPQPLSSKAFEELVAANQQKVEVFLRTLVDYWESSG